MREKEQIEQDEQLIKILRNYLQISSDSFKEHANVKEYKQYYYGNNREKVAPFVSNASNLIKPIIDTKITLILDNSITTSIVPKNISFANINQIKTMRDIADILNDCTTNVFDNNQLDMIKKDVVKNALITNNGLVKIYWNQDLSDGEGDVAIEFIDMENLFPDPNSKSVEAADFVILHTKQSVLSLKKKYPEFAEELDELAAKSVKKADGSGQSDKYIITTKTDQSTQQKYYGNNNSIQNLDKVIDVYEFYCKDETVFIPEENDPDLEEKEKQMMTQQEAYPDGRCIIFCGNKIVLEDKAMKNPFVNFFNESTETLFQPISLVKDLLFLQERINHAYYKLRDLMRKTLTLLAIDGASGITPGDIINQDAILLNPYALRDGLVPQVIQNNTITGMGEVINYIEVLKAQIYEIARINPMMISGEKAKGVTSGEQVSALNESPLTSIRDTQTQFANFMVRMTEKVIELIQKNYSLGRIVQLTSNEGQFASIPLREEGQPQEITLYDEALQVVKTIKGNLDLGKYSVRIIAGTQMPMSKTMHSRTTLDLVQLGVFDDPRTSTDSRKLILEAMDYPNRREIIKKMEQKDEEIKNLPPPEPPVDKISVAFKDLEFYPEAQQKILKDNGLLEAQVSPVHANQGILPQIPQNNNILQ
jgi:hypothetical protein